MGWGSRVQQEISHSLVHSPNSWEWARLQPGAYSFIQVSQIGGKGPNNCHPLLSQGYQQDAGLEVEWPELIWDVSIAGGSLTWLSQYQITAITLASNVNLVPNDQLFLFYGFCFLKSLLRNLCLTSSYKYFLSLVLLAYVFKLKIYFHISSEV